MKPVKVRVTGTFTFDVLMDEEDIELGVSLGEEGVHALTYRLDQRYGGYGKTTFVEAEGANGEVLDYGDFAEPQTCPNCLEIYYKGYKTAYIKVHGVCENCPDPELEELDDAI